MLNGIFKAHSGVIAGFMAVALLYIAGPAQADLQSGRIDLLTDFNVRIDGALPNDSSGYSVSGAGDVNGDGLDDVIVGAPLASHQSDPRGISQRWIRSGEAYIVFGKRGSGTPSVTLDLLLNIGMPGNHEGILITGAAEGDHAGLSVAGAGYVNDDDYADVIVGAPFAGNNFGGGPVLLPDPRSAGAAYVVYGKPDTDTVALADVGTSSNTEGFRIDGVADESTRAGWSVAGAGDVIGDDTPDVIVGAPAAHFNGPGEIGSAYVVKGNPASNRVALAEVGTSGNTAGFRIDGESVGESAGTGVGTLGAGFSVAGVGNVGGDERDDVIVGAPSVDYSGKDVGKANVVYGKSDTDTVALADVWSSGNGKGYQIIGASAGDLAGFSVSGAGDVNGDGIPDLIVGAPFADYPNSTDSGSAYVVLGKETVTAPVKLVDIGGPGNEDGFRIDGPLKNYRAGWSVDGAGDVNGDGTPDLLVGTPFAYGNSPNDQVSLPGQAGIAYLVHGKAEDTSTVNLAGVGSPGNAKGVLIAGAAAGDHAGFSVAAAGDFNGDRGADVIVGAPAADNRGRTGSGSSYIIYGVPPVDPVDPDPPNPPKGTQSAAGQPEPCPKILYENRLEVPREARLADLVKGKGLKATIGASEESEFTVTASIVGRDARRLHIYRKKSRKKNKVLARVEGKVGNKSEDVYLVAKGKTRRLIKRALRLKKVKPTARVKIVHLSHSVDNERLSVASPQTTRMRIRGRVRTKDTYTNVRQVLDWTDCTAPLRVKIKGPRQIKLSTLVTSKGRPGRGAKVEVSCPEEDCTATVGIRVWSGFEVGLGIRKVGQPRKLIASRKVKLSMGESKAFRLKVTSKRLRRLFVRAAKRKRYDRVKFKFEVYALTQSGDGNSRYRKNGHSSGTSRVLMRFR